MTTYSTRTKPNTSYNGRKGLKIDLGHLITQLGILCNNSGQRILFHTGVFYDNPTKFTGRTKPNTTYTTR